MGGGSSQSSTSNTNITTTSTYDVKDAYNTTYNDVRNLSDVGNVSVANSAGLGVTLPFAILGIVGLLVFMKMRH